MLSNCSGGTQNGEDEKAEPKNSVEQANKQPIKPRMLTLQNGCICCTLREDLIEQVAELAQDGNDYDYLIIESTGISEPLPVAQTFCHSIHELQELAKQDYEVDEEEDAGAEGEEEKDEVEVGSKNKNPSSTGDATTYEPKN